MKDQHANWDYLYISSNTLFEKATEVYAQQKDGRIFEQIAVKLISAETILIRLKSQFWFMISGNNIERKSWINQIVWITHMASNQEHPESGWRVWVPAMNFQNLLRYVLAHHEKWDGSGYPNGIKVKKTLTKQELLLLLIPMMRWPETNISSENEQKEAKGELLVARGTNMNPRIVNVFVNQ